jgi:hypothetical protein
VPYLRIEGFSGIIPKVTPGLLPDNAAQIARNVRLESRAIVPWNDDQLEFDPELTGDIRTIYRYEGPSSEKPVWFVSNTDIDFVLGPIADVNEYRLYFAGEAITPRKTNWKMATSAGKPPYPNEYYEMGTPGPITAPVLTASGGGKAPTEVRAYVYTFVTEFALVLEESAPSNAALVTCNTADDVVTVSGFDKPPIGRYNYKFLRIYRSVTGNSAVNYQLVAQLPIQTTEYKDSLAVQELGIVLASSYFTPPPAGLKGLVVMPGGFLAGFVGNQVWFSEPYIPHAWPSIYMQTTDFPIVGLAVLGNSLIVLTDRYPYTFTGSVPTGITSDKLGLLEPCVSKLSITSDQYGIIYASPNGLVSLSIGAQSLITQSLIRRDQWQDYAPETMFGEIYSNMYVGFYKGLLGVNRTLILYRNDNPPLSNYDFPGVASFVEPKTGDLFGVDARDNKIYQLDIIGTKPTREYQWKSKLFIMPLPTSFAWIQVLADFTKFSPEERPLTVRLYADREFFYEFKPNTTDPLRLPAIKRGYSWEVELIGLLPVLRVLLATTTAELKETT